MTAIPASSGPARRGDNAQNALRRGVYPERPGSVRSTGSSVIGADTASVLSGLGYDADDVRQMEEAGAIRTGPTRTTTVQADVSD
jgi:crotonobetainyl-CoA:carnitine CoA-transferase CaiB-like acyl-CoA transferase